MITIEQIRSARAFLGLKQAEIALKAGISIATLNNIERGVQKDPKMSTLRSIKEAFEHEGIEFLGSETGGVGIRLRTVKKFDRMPKALIIDDNEADRKLFSVWLTSGLPHGCEIVTASDARAGRDAFFQHKPDFIILDLIMYGISGFQIFSEMRGEHIKLPPILFVTSTMNAQIKKNAMSMGAHAFFEKSKLSKERLCRSVAKAIRYTET